MTLPPAHATLLPRPPRGRFAWRCGLGLLAGWLGLLGLVAARAAPVIAAVSPTQPVPEYNAKAGYVLLFTRYVQWPEVTFAAPESPVIIGILGSNPFNDVLEQTVQGTKSQGRPVVVRLVKDAEEAAGCHVVYIARGQERFEAGWLETLRHRPVLTVTESEQSLALGAVLSLELEKTNRGTKVVFSANLPTARGAGLQISASMLASARKVIRDPVPEKDRG